jgi:diguanylate cyclase (GGDEF)-like protein
LRKIRYAVLRRSDDRDRSFQCRLGKAGLNGYFPRRELCMRATRAPVPLLPQMPPPYRNNAPDYRAMKDFYPLPGPTRNIKPSGKFAMRGWPPRFVDEDVERQYLECMFESAARTRVITFLSASLLLLLSPFTANALFGETREIVSVFVGGALLIQLPLCLAVVWLSLNQSWSVRFTAPTIVVLLAAIEVHAEYLRLLSMVYNIDLPLAATILGLCLGLLVYGLPVRLVLPVLAGLFIGITGVEHFHFHATPQQNISLAFDVVLVGCSIIAGVRVDRARRDSFVRMALTEQQAYHDALTGLCNYWGFERDAERIVRHAARERRAITLAVVTVDRFSQIVETSGKTGSDAVLSRIGPCLNDQVRRPLDTAGYLRNDEFALLWYTPRNEFTFDIGNRIVEAVRAAAIPLPGKAGQTITVSVGVAALFPKGITDLDRLMRAAEEQLHIAKGAGHDTCRTAPLNTAGAI